MLIFSIRKIAITHLKTGVITERIVPKEARPTNSRRQFSANVEGWIFGFKPSEFSSELPSIFCSLEIFLDLIIQAHTNEFSIVH